MPRWGSDESREKLEKGDTFSSKRPKGNDGSSTSGRPIGGSGKDGKSDKDGKR